MSQPKKKRELWSRESMMAAVESVEDGKGLQAGGVKALQCSSLKRCF